MSKKRGRVEQVFQRAEAGLEPRVDRLVDEVPELIGEARRRRAAAAGSSPELLQSLVPLAWRALPRLGAVAALSVAVAAGVSLMDTPVPTVQAADTSDAGQGYEQLILTGSATSDDPLLQAITGTEQDG